MRVVVVTGAGRGFCAGADTDALDGPRRRGGYDPGTPDDIATPGYGVRREFDHDFAFHFGLTKPVIAAINGPAAGVGLGARLLLRPALRGRRGQAHDRARRLGLPAEYGLSWLLPRLVGLARATDLLLSSRVVPRRGGRARWAWSTRSSPATSCSPHTYAYAHELAHERRPGIAGRDQAPDLAPTCTATSATRSRTRPSGCDAMMAEPDFAEGVAALAEKRPPRF